MLRYDNIEFLYLLTLVPVLIIGVFLYSKWQKKSILKFGDIELVNQLMQSHSIFRKRIKNILFVLAILFLIIGLSNPQVGTKMEEVKREGVDLMIAIDLSYSMMAQDIKPNRLDRAKQAISRLIDKLEGDRIGLVVFAGEAYVQLPITTDYSAAKLFLSTVNTSIIPTQGTKIGNAIDLCSKSFDKENTQSKAIIIITDGETHDEEAIAHRLWRIRTNRTEARTARLRGAVRPSPPPAVLTSGPAFVLPARPAAGTRRPTRSRGSRRRRRRPSRGASRSSASLPHSPAPRTPRRPADHASPRRRPQSARGRRPL